MEPGVVVSQGSEVELFRPAFFRVQFAEQEHQISYHGLAFAGACGLPGAGAVENSSRLGIGREQGRAVIQSMIGQAAANGVEIIVTGAEGVFQRGEGADVAAALRREPIDPGIEQRRIVDGHGFIGAKGGENPGFAAGPGDGVVMREIVGGIVGGAEGTHPKLF